MTTQNNIKQYFMPFCFKFRKDATQFSIDEANSEILEWIKRWEENYKDGGKVTLQEYLSFSNKEYKNWKSGKWDAKKILEIHELKMKYIIIPISYFYRFFDFFKYKNFKRYLKMWLQRRIRGWDDSETWSLDYSLAKLISPRLKKLKEKLNNFKTFPNSLSTEEEGNSDECFDKHFNQWIKIIDKMILAFDIIIKNDTYYWNNQGKLDSRIEEGLDLFRKHYFDLWW
jgi:hypothetical protein